jgi:hypothetical protein
VSSRTHVAAREDGIAMVLVVFLCAFLALLGVTLIEVVRGESNRSAQQVTSGTAFQAAEAGIEDYISKIVDDRLYYVHYVHPGESTRQEPLGTTVAAGSDEIAWPYNLAWTYPNNFDHWKQLPNGYEYSLQIFPPVDTAGQMRIVAMGRKQNATTDTRMIETIIRPSSLADFYRVVNGDVGWGVGAITNGKIYANGDISHEGTATASVYAEGQVSELSAGDLQNGAKIYDEDDTNSNGKPDIRDQIKNPLNFSSFVTSFVDVERAAIAAGIHLDDPSKAAWKLTFKNTGTVDVQACTQTSGQNVAARPPTCGSVSNRLIPSNGAIYVAQTAVVSGVVDGRVTVASNDNIVVADHITYEQAGDDVLGLAAKNDLYVAWYVPDDLTWMAGVLVQDGTWQSWPNYQNSSYYAAAGNEKKSLMTFTGSSATDDGGSFTNMFTNRTYGYQQELLFLPPPWFPIVDDAYTVVLFRELPAT